METLLYGRVDVLLLGNFVTKNTTNGENSNGFSMSAVCRTAISLSNFSRDPNKKLPDAQKTKKKQKKKQKNTSLLLLLPHTVNHQKQLKKNGKGH